MGRFTMSSAELSRHSGESGNEISRYEGGTELLGRPALVGNLFRKMRNFRINLGGRCTKNA